MSVRIFKNNEHQQIFDRQGFLTLPFINANEIKQLNQLFDDLHPDLKDNGFFSGSYSCDFNYKKKASDHIVKVFSRAYEEIFTNYTPFGGAFLYKTPGENSDLAAHQDWTIVDENTGIALNCWVPLCDISLANGPIMILPGSQFSKHPVLRSPTIPFFFAGQEKIIMDELEPMLVKAGTAVILNQSVIHYSPPNKSDSVRKAITAGIKSADSPMYFHYKIPNEDKLEIFKEDDDFLLRFENFEDDIHERPKLGESVGFIDYKLPSYNDEELYQKIKKMKESAGFEMNTQMLPSEKIGLVNKIKEWWKK
jgi:hypothetical protein